jgi:hypothetical protein
VPGSRASDLESRVSGSRETGSTETRSASFRPNVTGSAMTRLDFFDFDMSGSDVPKSWAKDISIEMRLSLFSDELSNALNSDLTDERKT